MNSRESDTPPRPKRLAGNWKGTPYWLLLAGTLALGFYLVNAVHFAKEPLRIEESEWPPMAKAIYETGEPVINYDETHRVRYDENLEVDQGQMIGAWHPPLYLYTAGAAMVVLGESPNRIRAVGMVSFLCAVVLMLLIAREVTPRWRLIGGVAAILLLIHPFAIQGSVFLDIDTQLYAAVVMLAIWTAIRLAKRQEALGPAQVLAIGATLALVTWTKMTTTIVLVGVLAAWWVLSRRPFRRSLLEAVAFVATGAALFYVTYSLWCRLTDTPFSYTFEVTFAQKSDRLLSNFLVVEHAMHWHLRWFGAALLILALIYLVDLLRNLVAERQLRPLDLPYLFGLGVLVTYVFLSPTDGTYQGKYAFPALVAMVLPITWMLLRKSSEQKLRPLLWPAAIAIGVAAMLIVGDQITGLAEFNVNYGSWNHEIRLGLIAAVALGLAWFLGGRRGFAGGAIVVLGLLLVSQAVHSYRANTSPMYPIPDTGDFLAAVNDLNQSTPKGDIVIAPKDMGFYVKGLVVEGEDAFARGDARTAAAIRRYPRITAFARDSFGPPVGPETEALLQRCFKEERVYGSASIRYRTKRCG
jgi:4-amino-4-deoxy-L-arabinose transferase-like glycosyltransferase